MGKFIDLTNQTFNYLTVIKRVENNKYNKAQWLCKCICGNEKIVVGTELKQGKVKSCGCLFKEVNKKKIIDISGQIFGNLTAIAYEKTNKQGQALWKCKCACGATTIVSGIDLRSNKIQSCGCLTKIKRQKLMREVIQPKGAQARTKDLTGLTFDKLLVLEKDKTSTNSKWICRCECGNIKSIASSSLITGLTSSCGCLGNSRGEDKIREILLKNNINFVSEVSFSDLKDKARLRYDFGLLDENNNLIKLIEFDGRQHSDPSSKWHTSELLRHDEMKTKYCQEHNIPLLRISYKDLDFINLEMLLKKEGQVCKNLRFSKNFDIIYL